MTDINAQPATPIRNRRRRRLLTGAALAVVVAGGAAVAATSAWNTGAMTSGEVSDVHITVVISQRKLILEQDGNVVQTYDVAVGRPTHPTPVGDFSIRKIVWNPSWVPPDTKWAAGKATQPPGAKANPMKVVKMFLKEPDYYIHGTGDIESLGEAESHGCVRMHPDDAYTVARYLMEHGGAPHDENWFQRVLHFRRQTKTVYLGNPVPVTVQK
jgi:lipoprotein-anchoring transpeptidase ErfK/SrfK